MGFEKVRKNTSLLTNYFTVSNVGRLYILKDQIQRLGLEDKNFINLFADKDTNRIAIQFIKDKDEDSLKITVCKKRYELHINSAIKALNLELKQSFKFKEHIENGLIILDFNKVKKSYKKTLKDVILIK